MSCDLSLLPRDGIPKNFHDGSNCFKVAISRKTPHPACGHLLPLRRGEGTSLRTFEFIVEDFDSLHGLNPLSRLISSRAKHKSGTTTESHRMPRGSVGGRE